MHWFKHHSNLRYDPKIKRIIRKYGVEGYGLVCYLFELAATQLNETNMVPSIEETSEDLAYELKMDSRRIEEIVLDLQKMNIVVCDLDSKRLVVTKMIDLLDEYSRKRGNGPRVRQALNGLRTETQQDCIRIPSAEVALEENRSEEENLQRIDSSPRYPEAFEKWWQAYPKKVGKSVALERWKLRLKEMPPLVDHIKLIESWTTTPSWKAEGGKYIPNPAKWINERRWEDEIQQANEKMTKTDRLFSGG